LATDFSVMLASSRWVAFLDALGQRGPGWAGRAGSAAGSLPGRRVDLVLVDSAQQRVNLQDVD
jgi:hypothetical protein